MSYLTDARKCCGTPRGGDYPHLPTCQHAATVTTCDKPSAARKNWTTRCTICNETPTVGDTGLCGPHCFGEAETYGGNW